MVLERYNARNVLKTYLQSSVECVDNDSKGDEEGGSIDVHSGEGTDHSRSSEEKHGCHNDVCEEAEEEEHQVGRDSPSEEADMAQFELWWVVQGQIWAGSVNRLTLLSLSRKWCGHWVLSS